MDSASWIKRIEVATSQAEVVELVRQYIESRDPRDIAALPADCQPDRYQTAAEIAECAYRLAAYHGHDDNARVIQRIGSVMSRASVRLAELARA
jgi:hypothetical protein